MNSKTNEKSRSNSFAKTELNKQIGSNFDDFLQEENLLDESVAVAIKRVIAWQLAEAMKEQGISKS